MMPVELSKHSAPRTHATLQLLRKLALPHTIIHVGAGAGVGEMHQWQKWDVPNAYFIDADFDRLNWAENLIGNCPGWRVIQAALAASNGEAEFYQATNPDEDGLIAPEKLSCVWPNLQTVAYAKRPTRRLDCLLEEAGGETHSPWLFIDCIPALPILQGAGLILNQCSVLWLRALLQPVAGVDDGVTLESVETFLRPMGFRCVEVTESNHPAIGHALFVRDWLAVLQPQADMLAQAKVSLEQDMTLLKERIDALQKEAADATRVCDQQIQLAAERQDEIDQLSRARDELARRAAEYQAQLGEISNTRDEQVKLAAAGERQIVELTRVKVTLEQEKSTLSSRCEALQKEVSALSLALDQQSQLAIERQTQIDQLSQARDDQTKLAAERQEEILTLKQAIGTLEQEKAAQLDQLAILKKEVASISQARDEKSQLAIRRTAEMEQLRAEIKQKDARLAQLESDIAVFEQAREQQMQLVVERENQIVQLVHARDEQTRIAVERQDEILALKQTIDTLEQEKAAQLDQFDILKKEVAGISQARDEKSQLATQRTAEVEQLRAEIKQKDAHLAQLESNVAEMDLRQRLLNDEMTRTEAQIDLIKDVLLREAGL